MEKLFRIMKKETNTMVDIVWAENEADALSKYIKRTTGYWGYCSYSENDLYVTIA